MISNNTFNGLRLVERERRQPPVPAMQRVELVLLAAHDGIQQIKRDRRLSSGPRADLALEVGEQRARTSSSVESDLCEHFRTGSETAGRCGAGSWLTAMPTHIGFQPA